MMDLSLVSMDDLVEEIQKRHEAIIICALKDLGGKDEIYYQTNGSLFTLLGMAEDTVMRVQEELMENRSGL